MDDLPNDWEPGHNIKWEPGAQGRAKTLAAAFLMLALAAISFLIVCAAVLSACVTHTGDITDRTPRYQFRDATKMMEVNHVE